MFSGRRSTRWIALSRQLRPLLVLVLCWTTACKHADTPVKYLLPGDQTQDYVHQATQISYAEVDQPLDPRVDFATEPRRLSRLEEEEIWDLTLAEAIQLALTNSRVIRSAGQFLNPGNPILTNPDFVNTIYDPAIHESGVLFGQRGVEAALSDFDTQFTTQALWGRSEALQNNAFSSGGLAPGSTQVNETSAVSAVLQKRLATGGQFALSHSWNYTGTNVPAALFPSVYEGNVRGEFRQPLLAGGGVGYTRIAGPVSTNIQGVTGVQQGVIIARINGDIGLADFERAVAQLVHDVEALYWQLHLAYRSYDVNVRTQGEILSTWQLVEAQRQAKTGVGGQEIGIREAEITYEGQVAQARNQVYSMEAQLRLLLGLPVNDGRIIRPVDDPMTAQFAPDWTACLTDALARRPEIRRQKWNIKSLEMQLLAAENLTMPRLDFLAAYQVNGFGDNLLGDSYGNLPATNSARNLGSAYGTLLDGEQSGWNLGFEFSMPLGRRFALAQQRSLELRLAKAQELLGAQEVEISHEVAASFRDLDNNYILTENALNRLLASQERLQISTALYKSDPRRNSIENVLRAQESVGQAELQFLNALVQYNSSINDLHYRTGRSLASNNILLTEGAWQAEAQVDADAEYERRRHAWENPLLRDHPILDGVYSAPGGYIEIEQGTEPTPVEPEPILEEYSPTPSTELPPAPAAATGPLELPEPESFGTASLVE